MGRKTPPFSGLPGATRAQKYRVPPRLVLSPNRRRERRFGPPYLTQLSALPMEDLGEPRRHTRKRRKRNVAAASPDVEPPLVASWHDEAQPLPVNHLETPA